MKKPLIQRVRFAAGSRHGERGVTIFLVALAMVAIIAMAALSIDIVTLYLAREEAQQSADNAALAAAKVLALSGLTGDPNNSSGQWATVCGPDDGTNGLATRVAKAVAKQDQIGSQPATTINVTYSAGNGGSIGPGVTDCSTLATSAFGVNPMVTVRLQRTQLPTFFSRIWGNSSNSVSASATAEAFNSSNSGNVGNSTPSAITPVQPRCVKPWVVPNRDPGSPGGAGLLVDRSTGSIQRQGISLNGSTSPGLIGETFWLEPDCGSGSGTCTLPAGQPSADYSGPGGIKPVPNLLYVPAQVGTPVIASPSCKVGDITGDYGLAIAGCDQPTNYSCGTPIANAIDTTINPIIPTTNGVQCLIQQTDTTNVTSASGQDYFGTFAAPATYPFQILAGSNNPTAIASGTPISNSASIVSLPIYDNDATTIIASNRNSVTFVGFLQVFINAVDATGSMQVTVLNVSGCGNGTNSVGTPVIGNSPVPVRLITPP